MRLRPWGQGASETGVECCKAIKKHADADLVQIGESDAQLPGAIGIIVTAPLVAGLPALFLAFAGDQVLRDLEQRCHEAEQAVLSGAAEAPTVEPGELDLGHAPGLTQRLAQLGTSLQALSPEALEERLKQLQALCIRAEVLAGTDPPEPFHEERMSYQVKRLAERMTGEARQSLREEADELEALWLGNGPLPPGDASDQTRKRLLAALFELDSQRP